MLAVKIEKLNNLIDITRKALPQLQQALIGLASE
jgi:hypothetical protein